MYRHCYKSLDKQELQVPHRKIMPGQICAARYLTQWHRAEFVCRLMDNENSVIVHFVDYGTTAEILLEDIRYLLHEFSTLPCQAFRGCMDYIRPAGHKWARDATYSFLSIVCEKMIYAKATNIDYKVMFYDGPAQWCNPCRPIDLEISGFRIVLCIYCWSTLTAKKISKSIMPLFKRAMRKL